MNTKPSFDDRFLRISMLTGPDSLAALKASHVTIVGLGAVGSFALESLARTGIGRFRLVDFDVLRPSNTNRQILALSDTFGRKKVDIAKERILSINPDCSVETIECFFDSQRFDELFCEPTDIVVDAIDSFTPKVALLSLLHTRGISLVSSMGAARRTNPGMVVAGDISDVEECRLGSVVRKKLKKLGIRGGIRCVYSTEKLIASMPRSEKYEEEYYKRGRERVPFGSIVFVPAAFGIRIGYEVWRFIINGKKFPKENKKK